MQLSAYQLDILRALSSHSVQYAAIGGRAMQAHGIARETRDLDLLIARSPENARSLFAALAEVPGVSLHRISESDLQLPRKRVSLPTDGGHEVDILTSVGALDEKAALVNAELMDLEGVRVRVLGLPELIYTKIVPARSNQAAEAKERDLNDLAELLKRWQSAA